jgi:hypothetical protein
VTYRMRFAKPGEMSGDDVAGGSDSLVSLVVSAKARKLRPGNCRVTCAYLGALLSTAISIDHRYPAKSFPLNTRSSMAKHRIP